jgi:tRNA nucleotidyltransferase (CCA-adding enzyme)
MEIYKVGGCIRDKLLGIPSNDTDFVVVGSTPEAMIKLGFKPVGSDFPVFLHPKTKEEYALARSEKKVAIGYRGFTFNAAPDISLKDDLARRDITINAIAEDENGNLIDPFGGQNDLKNRVIRHISDAFTEDPLRVLRVARFSAKLNFKVADETLILMKEIVSSGELKSLSAERIWLEINKTMMTYHSSNFFKTLHNCSALEQILPEFVPLIKDLDNFNLFTTMSQTMSNNNYSTHKRFGVLFYFVSNYFPIDKISEFINKSGMNKQSKAMALLIVKYYNNIKTLNKLSIDSIYSIIANIDPTRRVDRYLDFIDLSYFIASSKNETQTIHHLGLIKQIVNDYQHIKYNEIRLSNPSDFINTIHQEKLKVIKEAISTTHAV